MSGILDHYQVELFRINQNELEEAIKNLRIYQYSVHFGQGIKDLIPKDTSRFWHVVELLRSKGIDATVRESERKHNIVVLKPLKMQDLFAYHIDAKDFRIVLGEPVSLTLDLHSDADLTVFRRFLQIELQNRLKEPLVVERWRIYDRSKKIDVTPSRESSQLANYFEVFQSIDYRLTKFGNEYFLAILPQSRLSYNKSIDSLLRSKIVDPSEISDKFPYVSLPPGIGVRLIGLLEKTVLDPVHEDAVLAGRSFKQFAEVMYPNLNLEKDDSKLAVIGVRSGSNVVSSEVIFPSPNFSTIRSLDEAYYSSLISRLKLNSVRRLDEAVDWVQKLVPLSADGEFLINVETTPHEILH